MLRFPNQPTHSQNRLGSCAGRFRAEGPTCSAVASVSGKSEGTFQKVAKAFSTPPANTLTTRATSRFIPRLCKQRKSEEVKLWCRTLHISRFSPLMPKKTWIWSYEEIASKCDQSRELHCLSTSFCLSTSPLKRALDFHATLGARVTSYVSVMLLHICQ